MSNQGDHEAFPNNSVHFGRGIDETFGRAYRENVSKIANREAEFFGFTPFQFKLRDPGFIGFLGGEATC